VVSVLVEAVSTVAISRVYGVDFMAVFPHPKLGAGPHFNRKFIDFHPKESPFTHPRVLTKGDYMHGVDDQSFKFFYFHYLRPDWASTPRRKCCRSAAGFKIFIVKDWYVAAKKLPRRF